MRGGKLPAAEVKRLRRKKQPICHAEFSSASVFVGWVERRDKVP